MFDTYAFVTLILYIRLRATRASKIDSPSDPLRSKRKLVIVKGGGSALTVKSTYETLQQNNLDSLAIQINACKRDDPLLDIIIIHGAGSFGHFDARQYALKTGGYLTSWKEGFSRTRRSVCRLTGHVIDAFVNYGVDAVAVEMFPSTTAMPHKILDVGNLDSVRNLLDRGFTPVLHGDAVLWAPDISDVKRCTILSGDTIMEYLCEVLKPDAAVFLTDVAGVYDRAPLPGSQARLLSRIEVDNNGMIVNMKLPETTIQAHDVTGGILGKIQSASLIASTGCPVYICQIASAHAAQALAGNAPSRGTTITITSTHSNVESNQIQ